MEGNYSIAYHTCLKHDVIRLIHNYRHDIIAMEYAVAFILSMTYPHQNLACPVDWTTSIPIAAFYKPSKHSRTKLQLTGIPVWYMECNVLHCTILPH